MVELTMTRESYPTHHTYLTDLFPKLGNNYCKFYGVLKKLGCQIRQPYPNRRQIPEKKFIAEFTEWLSWNLKSSVKINENNDV